MHDIHYKTYVLVDNRGSKRYVLTDRLGSSSISFFTDRQHDIVW